MNRKDMLINEISGFSLPPYNEIPNVGLFLKQVTKYITGYMEPLESVSMTESMVSNYVKQKIIKNPIRKQYDREQIAELLFIAMTKTVLTLEDIQLLLQMIPEDVTMETAYEAFRTEMLDTLHAVFEGKEIASDLPEEPAIMGEAAEDERLAAAEESPETEVTDQTDDGIKIREERQLLRHTVITVAHKIYIDKYFKAVKNQ